MKTLDDILGWAGQKLVEGGHQSLGIVHLPGICVEGFHRKIENQLGPITVVDIAPLGMKYQLTLLLVPTHLAIFSAVKHLDEKQPPHQGNPNTNAQNQDKQHAFSLLRPHH